MKRARHWFQNCITFCKRFVFVLILRFELPLSLSLFRVLVPMNLRAKIRQKWLQTPNEGRKLTDPTPIRIERILYVRKMCVFVRSRVSRYRTWDNPQMLTNKIVDRSETCQTRPLRFFCICSLPGEPPEYSPPYQNQINIWKLRTTQVHIKVYGKRVSSKIKTQWKKERTR